MDILGRVMNWISNLAAAVAGGLLILMTGHILLEIFLRFFFDRSTYVLDEFVGYEIASMTFLSLAYTLNDGAHIRVNLLLGWLPRQYRRGVELFSASFAIVLIGYIFYFFARSWARSWARGTVSGSIAEIPLWIPEGIVLIGLGVFLAQLIVYTATTAFGGPLLKVKSE